MKIAITGTTGRLGGALVRHHRTLGNDILALDRTAIDLSLLDTLEARLEPLSFDALIHPASMTGLEDCEDHPELATRVNAEAPGILAAICARRQCPFIHVSTDYVFDGVAPGLRRETDPAAPISVYGRTKLMGEQAVHAAYPTAWVTRVSWLFGPERPGFVEMIRGRLLCGDPLAAIDDKVSCPTYVDDIAVAFDRLLALTESPGGVVHVCNPGETSWYDYAREIVTLLGVPQAPIARQKLAEMEAFRAARPIHTAMAVERLPALTGYHMRPWKEALEVYLRG